jgi:hypothetical protein
MYERPIPDYLQPDYIAAEDLALEFGLSCETIRQKLQAARVPSREYDGHLWYAEVAARARLATPRQLAMADEAEAAEATIAAGTLPVGPIRFRSVGWREGDDD